MTESTCSIEGCARNTIARGWCNKHYKRWQAHGDPEHEVDTSRAVEIQDLPNGDRVCTKCGQAKPLSGYHKDSRGTRGHRGVCKQCRSAWGAERYQRNSDTIKQRIAEYREANRDLIRNQDSQRYSRHREARIALATKHFHIRRARILDRNPDSGITVKRLRALLGPNCPYCKKRMDFNPGRQSKYNPSRASIEHLVPISKGGTHTWDNAILCCLQCNLRRGNRAANVQMPLMFTGEGR